MQRVVIIGAGIGGLVAALLLSQAGLEVTVCEAAATPGGKLHEVRVGGANIDAGPTVFTLRPVFEAIFAQAGETLDTHLTLQKLDILARHGWEDGARLDLFADAARSEAAIGDFAGAAAARGYAKFRKRAQEIFETLDASFMQAQQPGLLGLLRNAGPGLLKISPFGSLWSELGQYFPNPKLRQLFARYATYCGSSPFDAPATLMLIAHAEQLGVWTIEGGMHRLAQTLAALAAARGATFHYATTVDEILTQNGKASGVRLADGTAIAADAVVANVELAALDAGLFGAAAQAAVGGMMKGARPSLSAMTWAMSGTASGFDLAHHNVFFSNDYAAEFRTLAAGTMPEDPTIYLCAPGAAQRYFCLINAPAAHFTGGAGAKKCLNRVLLKLKKCGLALEPSAMRPTTPADWAQKFPASQGALYGRALTGWRDPFARPGAASRMPGLYLAGGAVHPGPGLPMAALSGRLAAERLLADCGSTRRSVPVAMPGGMSMQSAMTGSTRLP